MGYKNKDTICKIATKKGNLVIQYNSSNWTEMQRGQVKVNEPFHTYFWNNL